MRNDVKEVIEALEKFRIDYNEYYQLQMDICNWIMHDLVVYGYEPWNYLKEMELNFGLQGLK